MAVTQDINITDCTFVADADLTAKQYHYVMPASTPGNVQIATGASNPAPIGVLQNSPSAGQEASVRALGFTKLVVEANSSSPVNWAKGITCASDGQGEVLTAATCPFNSVYYGANVTSGSAIGQAYLFGAGFCACMAAAS